MGISNSVLKRILGSTPGRVLRARKYAAVGSLGRGVMWEHPFDSISLLGVGADLDGIYVGGFAHIEKGGNKEEKCFYTKPWKSLICLVEPKKTSVEK